MGNAVTRAVDILELLADRSGLHAREIASSCGIPRSSVYELLRTLQARGLIDADAAGRWSLQPSSTRLSPAEALIGGAVAVVDAFQHERAHADLPALVRRSGLHATTVRRTLDLLEAESLVVADDAGRYSVGLRAALLAAKFRPVEQLQEAARPVLWKLCERLGETTSLLIRDGSCLLYIDRFETPRAVRAADWLGRQIPLGRTATGRAIAHEDGPYSARDVLVTGTTAVACAVRGAREYPAAISITGPNRRLHGERLQQVRELVSDASDTVAARLLGTI